MIGVIFKIVFILTAGVANACNITRTLPDLERRARNHRAVENDPLINDLLLRGGWYRVTGYTGQYIMPDSTVDTPSDGCGTINQIYIKGTHPEVPSETEVKVVACVQEGPFKCYSEITILIRNCSGELQYKLPTTERFQAYCFDPPAIQGITNFSAAPRNFHPGPVTIASGIEWTTLNNSGTKYYEPKTYFECSFNESNQTADLFYKITWIVDDRKRFQKGPSKILAELRLTAAELVETGLYFGIELRCAVQASVDESGAFTSSISAKEFFAGIEILNKTVVLNSTMQNLTIWFHSTVSIGCNHGEHMTTCGTRTLTVQMKNPNYNCSKNSNSLFFQRCNNAIELQARNDSATSGKLYQFIVTSNFQIHEATHFELHLQTGYNKWTEPFFHNQTLPPVSVIVNSGNWTSSHCFSHVDPHMQTFDGINYENQESGDFVLYRNNEYGVEVQERTQPCYRNRARCTCQVAVRAGGDVYVMNRCPGLPMFNEFRTCREGSILDVEEVTANKIKIHTPIGTDVIVTTYNYDGYFMNVDIYSSPKDLLKVQGLCGYYDGDSTNDFKMPDERPATYRNADYSFSRSWKVSPGNGLLTGYKLPLLHSWATNNSLVCVCMKSNVFLEMQGNESVNEVAEASCDKFNKTGCGVFTFPNKPNKCNKKTDAMLFEQAYKTNVKERSKRSVDSDVPTEDEVRGYCSNIIRNAPSVTHFPERLKGESIDEVIEQCVFDVLAVDGDLSVGEIHVQSLSDVVKQTFSYEPTFVTNNTEMIQLFLRETCPNNCSGRGVCSKDGKCICASLFHGHACELNERDPINVDLIQGDGVCDTASGDDCRCHWFYTNNLLENFFCRFRQFKVYQDSTKSYMDELVVPGDYDDMYTGQCCIPETRNKRSVESTGLGYEWELAVSNDGTHFGTGQTLYIIDKTCLDVITNSSTNERGLKLKDSYCLIDFQCVGDIKMRFSDHCNICNVHMDQFGWTYVCQETKEAKNLSPKIIGIAVGTSVGGVVAVICVVICIYNRFNIQTYRLTKKKTSMNVQDTCHAFHEGPYKTNVEN